MQESKLKGRYNLTETKVGETPKSNYYLAFKKSDSLEDHNRVIKIVSFGNLVDRQVTPEMAGADIKIKLANWKELARKHCHVIGLEFVDIDVQNQRVRYIPDYHMPYSLYDLIRRKNKNNVKLNKNNSKDKEIILFIQKNFLPFAYTIFSVIHYLQKAGHSFANLKTENVLIRSDSHGFTKLFLTDLFLVNSSKEDRNILFRCPESTTSQADPEKVKVNGSVDDVHALGIILYELSTCQIFEKPRNCNSPQEIRNKILEDLEKDESIEGFQKSVIQQCLKAGEAQNIDSVFSALSLHLTFERSKMPAYDECGLANHKNKIENVAIINKQNIIDLELAPLLSSTNKRELVASKIEVKKVQAAPQSRKPILDDRSSRTM